MFQVSTTGLGMHSLANKEGSSAIIPTQATIIFCLNYYEVSLEPKWPF